MRLKYPIGTVINKVEVVDYKERNYHLICRRCNNHFKKRSDGFNEHCCNKCYRTINNKYQVGDTVGSVKILKETHIGKRKAYLLRCSCGHEFCRNTGFFKENCLNCKKCSYKNLSVSKTRKDKETHVITIYNKYKTASKQRHLCFNISLDFFKSLIFENCYYCNSIPSNKFKLPNKTHENYFIYYNGIDRIDSTKGYLEDNCVSCCKICNTSKSNIPMEEWKNWIINISSNLKTRKII